MKVSVGYLHLFTQIHIRYLFQRRKFQASRRERKTRKTRIFARVAFRGRINDATLTSSRSSPLLLPWISIPIENISRIRERRSLASRNCYFSSFSFFFFPPFFIFPFFWNARSSGFPRVSRCPVIIGETLWNRGRARAGACTRGKPRPGGGRGSKRGLQIHVHACFPSILCAASRRRQRESRLATLFTRASCSFSLFFLAFHASRSRVISPGMRKATRRFIARHRT